ncbi:hypothetical protein ACFXTO_035866 [Malus domestica]
MAAAAQKKIPGLTKGIALSSHPKRLNVVISSRSQRGEVKKHATKCCSSSWEDTTLLSDPEKLAVAIISRLQTGLAISIILNEDIVLRGDSFG